MWTSNSQALLIFNTNTQQLTEKQNSLLHEFPKRHWPPSQDHATPGHAGTPSPALPSAVPPADRQDASSPKSGELGTAARLGVLAPLPEHAGREACPSALPPADLSTAWSGSGLVPGTDGRTADNSNQSQLQKTVPLRGRNWDPRKIRTQATSTFKPCAAPVLACASSYDPQTPRQARPYWALGEERTQP